MKSLPINNKKHFQEQLASMLRVNQAGEYGAKRIYLGQLSILKNDPVITEMLEQELVHLDYFNAQIKARRVRPTVLQPLWHIGGFLLGAATAFMGRHAAMACTVAVEDVIGHHYQEQIDTLSQIQGEEDLTLKVTAFCKDELEHREKGLEHGALDEALNFKILKTIVKCITKTAIFLSKRY